MQINILDLLRADGSIVVNKALAHIIGLHEAVVLSELISRHRYHEQRGELDNDGMFYMTIEKLEEQTTLSKHVQTKSIKKLSMLGLIKSIQKGLPAKRFILIDGEAIFNLVANKKLKNLTTGNDGLFNTEKPEKPRGYQKLKNLTTGRSKIEQLEVKKFATSNTNVYNTDFINKEEEEVKGGGQHDFQHEDKKKWSSATYGRPLDKKQKRDKLSTTTNDTAYGEERKANPFTFYQENFGMLTPHISEDIRMWCEDINDELVIKAMQLAIEANIRKWAYVKSTLQDWLGKGIFTVADAISASQEFKANKETFNHRHAVSDRTSYKPSNSRKPSIPIVSHDIDDHKPISQEELAELKALAKKLDGNGS